MSSLALCQLCSKRQLSKPSTVAIQPLSTRLIKPNLCSNWLGLTRGPEPRRVYLKRNAAYLGIIYFWKATVLQKLSHDLPHDFAISRSIRRESILPDANQ